MAYIFNSKITSVPFSQQDLLFLILTLQQKSVVSLSKRHSKITQICSFLHQIVYKNTVAKYVLYKIKFVMTLRVFLIVATLSRI